MEKKTILITGSSSGIGKAAAEIFLKNNYLVYGIDQNTTTIEDKNYQHFKVSVTDFENLPDLKNISYILNNAGTMDEQKSLETNLQGYINIINKYESKDLKAVLNIASTAGHHGFGKPLHAAAQAARINYTKHLAKTLGEKNQTLVNSLSPGPVHTNLEPDLYKDKTAMSAVANQNILKRWISPTEIAEWIYFILIKNTCATGQDIILDLGECINLNFISPTPPASQK